MSRVMRGTRRSLVFVLALAVAGCATHPYVPFEPISVARKEEVSLGTAIDYANSARARYESALISEAERRNGLATGLIVLGAAVLGMAALDAHRDALIVAGLAGGTGYALGTWNESRPREQIYVEGMKAMSCAIDAVIPLNFSRSSTSNSVGAAALNNSFTAETICSCSPIEGTTTGADMNAF